MCIRDRFAGVLGILIAGGLALAKGIRGKWDNEVKPEEMVGPGGDKNTSDDDKKEDS